MGLEWDRYTYQARLLPTVIVLLPAWLAAVSWLPADDLVKSVAASGIGWFGLAALLSQLGRDQGKQKEQALFDLWAGPPTTRLLRHRDTTLSPELRTRYQHKISQVCCVAWPTPGAEAADPTAADRAYDACVRILRIKTSDRKKFRLLFHENINYGFRRNLWGMKGGGTALAVVGVLASGARIALDYSVGQPVGAVSAASITICSALLAWWIARIRPRWVKVAADAYAEQLLAASEKL